MSYNCGKNELKERGKISIWLTNWIIGKQSMRWLRMLQINFIFNFYLNLDSLNKIMNRCQIQWSIGNGGNINIQIRCLLWLWGYGLFCTDTDFFFGTDFLFFFGNMIFYLQMPIFSCKYDILIQTFS